VSCGFDLERRRGGRTVRVASLLKKVLLISMDLIGATAGGEALGCSLSAATSSKLANPKASPAAGRASAADRLADTRLGTGPRVVAGVDNDVGAEVEPEVDRGGPSEVATEGWVEVIARGSGAVATVSG